MMRILITTLMVWCLSASGIGAADGREAGEALPALTHGGAGDAMTDIHDIKPLEVFGLDPAVASMVVCVLLAVLAAVTVIGFLAWWSRRRRAAVTVLPELSPDERALDALRRLKASGLLPERILYFRLTALFREYLRGRFDINAPEMTTEELLPLYGKLELDSELHGAGREFLGSSDLVKYAGVPADAEKIARHVGFVETFVYRTTPAKEEVTA